MQTVQYEAKIMGINLYWISALLVGTYVILCALGGDLINLSFTGFEVIFPFYAALAVGEWSKTRSDPMFDLIKAQGMSLFGWVLKRYLYVFTITGLFAAIGMIAVCAIRREAAFIELLPVYFSTAFLLSTFCILVSFFSNHPHMATMACGVLWLFAMLVKSLLRISFVPYIYLFIRFADEANPVWIINKFILFCIGLFMWIVIFLICKARPKIIL